MRRTKLWNESQMRRLLQQWQPIRFKRIVKEQKKIIHRLVVCLMQIVVHIAYGKTHPHCAHTHTHISSIYSRRTSKPAIELDDHKRAIYHSCLKQSTAKKCFYWAQHTTGEKGTEKYVQKMEQKKNHNKKWKVLGENLVTCVCAWKKKTERKFSTCDNDDDAHTHTPGTHANLLRSHEKCRKIAAVHSISHVFRAWCMHQHSS